MKSLPLLVVLFLSSIYTATGQQPEWKIIRSVEFHFIASFPGDPEQKSEDIAASFGSASARRWILELPGVSYEVLVADFPNLSVKMENKALYSFYDVACGEFAGGRCDVGDDQFGELGRRGWSGTKTETIEYLMYLAGKRLYLAKVVTKAAMEKQTREDRKKFLDEFLFIHVEENEKKLKWGLPKTASQNRKDS